MSSAQIVSASVLQNKFSPPSPLPQAVFSTSSRVQGSWELGLGRGTAYRAGLRRGSWILKGPWALSHLCSSGAAPLSWDSSLDPLRSEYCGASSRILCFPLATTLGSPSHLGPGNS